jgi:hypothetical protein
VSHEENGYPQRTGYLPCLPPRPATGPRGLAALGAAVLSTGLLTATTAPTAGGRDKSPGSHRSRWPDRFYPDLAGGGAAHVVWPTSMR